MQYNDAPDYLRTADLHNLGAGNTSFFDNPVDETVDFVSKIPAFAVTSIASGINSIYNSGVAAGNFFNLTDAKENDLQQTLGTYDADLSNYYAAHKQATDLAGFVGTSFLPGVGGVKLFQTGQRVLAGALESGGVAATIAKGTGLIPTLTAEGKTLAQVAGEALAQGQQTFKLMDAGVLKAIGGGVAQATLESAAFEAMVQATMFRSPVLETQDIKDVGSNILTGALLGGAIGGAINAAGTYGTIKKVISAADLEQKKFTLRSSQFALPEASDKIVVAAHDLSVTPVAANVGEEALRSRRISDIFQEIRTNIHSLVGGKDGDLGNVIADTFQGSDGDTIAKAFQGAVKISRPAAMGEANEGFTVGYVKLHGEGVGSASFDAIKPSQLTLADTVPGGRESILSTVKSYADGWKAKGNLWSPKTANSMNEVEARYIWAEKLAKYEDGMTIHVDDIPLLEGALRNKINTVNITDGVHEYQVGFADLQNEVAQSKMALASELEKSKRAGWGMNAGAAPDKNVSTITSDEIARAVNVSVKRLESDESASMFARQDAQAAYDAMRLEKKITQGESDLSFIPQHAAVAYKTAGMAEANTTAMSAMINIKQTQKVAQAAIDKAVQGITGDLGEQLVRPGDTAIINSNRYGAGAGLVTFANGAVGTLASWAENIGSVTSRIQAKLQKDTANVLDSVSLKLRTNQAAAIEFDKINNIVASSTEKYVLNDAGDGLIAAKVKDYQDKVRAGVKGLEAPVLQQGAPDAIPFTSDIVGEAVAARIQTNGARVVHQRNLRAAQGLEDAKNESAFYPIKPQPKDYPFFAFVKDETITGAGMGHTSMIHAATQTELDDMIKMARSKSGYSVYTKADTENFYKAQQAYEYDRTLHDNYMDAGLKSAGVNNQFFPKTDPNKIVDGWLDLERRADDVLARETVSAKFGHEFDQLETLGQQYTNVASSRYGTTAKSIEATVQNPYNDYRKTALNISRLSEYPLLSAFNRNLENAVDGVIQKVVNVWQESQSVNDLQKVNAALEAAGINHAYKNAAEIVLANHSAPKPYLSSFIRGANAILSNTFLRLDPLNALNNAIGAQVLLGSETNATVKALMRDLDAGGVMVPGTDSSILSPAKLIGKANANYFKALGETDTIAVQNRAYYKENGWTSSIMDQHRAMLDQLSLSGAENPAQLNTKLANAMAIGKQLAEKGEKISGNKLAEEYNRYVAADVARQIGEARIAAGLMTQDGMTPFISTFVNRTQGNVLASQRPLIFQGPVGQAIGLFQSFQFNTMQQLFRNISEGGAKDAAMMMGLQGTMYGLNGLPGFQYINTHIVGTASGNPQHTDAYSALYGAAGKTAGDWLMYGVPSNMLQTNIYTRGDINPRTLTVIPTNPQDIVAVSAFAKFAGNIKETVSKIAGGGDVWQSILQGFEHNTLSRPLAGLAQTMQAIDGGKVFSTTNSGDISFVNDLFSVATLSRLAGGKPLDEALVNDEVSRAMVYKAADRERIKAATETFKTHVIGPNPDVSPDVVHNYMNAYVHAGGDAKGFNQQVLSTLTKTNTPKANQVMAALKGPYAEHMKTLMGQSVEDLQAAQ